MENNLQIKIEEAFANRELLKGEQYKQYVRSVIDAVDKG